MANQADQYTDLMVNLEIAKFLGFTEKFSFDIRFKDDWIIGLNFVANYSIKGTKKFKLDNEDRAISIINDEGWDYFLSLIYCYDSMVDIPKNMEGICDRFIDFGTEEGSNVFMKTFYDYRGFKEFNDQKSDGTWITEMRWRDMVSNWQIGVSQEGETLAKARSKAAFRLLKGIEERDNHTMRNHYATMAPNHMGIHVNNPTNIVIQDF